MWKVATGQSLGHYGWNEEFVVYNSLSGDTHLLESFVMDVLLLLRDAGPMSTAALYEAMGPLDDADPGTGDCQPDFAELTVVLEQLQSLALLDRV
jgi:PqqD family protein of HPr-rel-A system